jgi:hypothetical protein
MRLLIKRQSPRGRGSYSLISIRLFPCRSAAPGAMQPAIKHRIAARARLLQLDLHPAFPL